MTTKDDTGAAWLLREMWDVPAEVTGSFSDDDNLQYGKALVIAAKGDGVLADAERDWILGYLTCAGFGGETIQALSSYAGDDDFRDLFTRGVLQYAPRSCIADAIAACGADGDLGAGEVAAVHRLAELISVPSDVVDQFVEIYKEEQALRARRIALAFPGGYGI